MLLPYEKTDHHDITLKHWNCGMKHNIQTEAEARTIILKSIHKSINNTWSENWDKNNIKHNQAQRVETSGWKTSNLFLEISKRYLKQKQSKHEKLVNMKKQQLFLAERSCLTSLLGFVVRAREILVRSLANKGFVAKLFQLFEFLSHPSFLQYVQSNSDFVFNDSLYLQKWVQAMA